MKCEINQVPFGHNYCDRQARWTLGPYLLCGTHKREIEKEQPINKGQFVKFPNKDK